MSDIYFTKPERPFLLIYTDIDDSVSYAWLETEDELKEVIEEIGYTLTSVNVEEYKKKFSLFGR